MNRINAHAHYAPAEALAHRAREIIKDRTGVALSWNDIADSIYDPLVDLAHTVQVGDTIELPNGCTLRVEWKPAAPAPAPVDHAKRRALAMAGRLEVMARGLDGEGLHEQAEKNRAKAMEIREANK